MVTPVSFPGLFELELACGFTAFRLSRPRRPPPPGPSPNYRVLDNGTICKYLSCPLWPDLNTKRKSRSKIMLLILGHDYGRYSEYGLQK